MRRTGLTQDPQFNTITVKSIRGIGQQPVTINSDIEMSKLTQLSLCKLNILLEDTSDTGFTIDIDENKPTSLVIKRMINSEIKESGILYDTQFNRPDSELLISPLFTLPEEQTDAIQYYLKNSNFILQICSNQETNFTLPPLLTNGSFDNTQIRISNTNNNLINIIFEENIIIQMTQERISLVWKKENDKYKWIYVP